MSTLLLALLIAVAPTTPSTSTTTTATATTASASARAPYFHKGTAPSSSPQRIVSLSPMVTETLFALGVGARVAGVTRYCDKPAAATTLPKVGGYTDVSLEAVLARKPDLVIAQYAQGQWPVLDRLRERGIAVFIVFNDTFAESLLAIDGLAVVVGQPAAGPPIVARQHAALAAAADSAHGQRVVVVVGLQPLVVAGAWSFADTAVRATGATSVITDSDPAWPVWSLETLLARHVDVVVVADGGVTVAAFQKRVAALGARAPRVVASNHAILMRPGPTFADDVATLAALLHAPAPQ